ncbi:MAG: RodZ domain-containing protein [Gammaproteobacteria bacterium]
MPAEQTDIDAPKQGGAASAQGGGLGLGDRLRSARKARAMSLERISEALNLDESVVLALEDERFEELGAPVFVRGHLKAYAKLVGLAEDVVLDSYGRDATEVLTIRASEKPVRRSVTVNPVIWGFSSLVVLLGLILTIYVMQDDEPAGLSKPLPVSSAAPAEASADPAAAASVDVSIAEDPARVAPRQPVAAPVAPAPVIAAPVARQAEPEEPPAVVANDVPEPVTAEPAPEPVVVTDEPASRPSAELVRLNLNFREESWVEISDANQRLLFGLQRKGRKRELAGEPPFRLLIGNASGVDVTVNDEPFVVPASNVTGKVARFEISAASTD